MKRFTAEKMVQIEQLMSYATLMGLTGEDLVSIGGKMARAKTKIAAQANMEIVRGYICHTIGRDSHPNDRWKLKFPHGSYNIESDGWSYDRFIITSLKTKQRVTVAVNTDYPLPRVGYKVKGRYCFLLDLAAGRIQLNF